MLVLVLGSMQLILGQELHVSTSTVLRAFVQLLHTVCEPCVSCIGAAIIVSLSRGMHMYTAGVLLLRPSLTLYDLLYLSKIFDLIQSLLVVNSVSTFDTELATLLQ